MSDGFHEKVGTAVGVNSARGDHYGERVTASTPIMDAVPPGAQSNLGFAVGAKRWGASGDAFYGVPETHDQLPAGLYRPVITQNGPILIKQRVETDNLLELPDDAGAAVIAEFTRFWEIGDRFRERGFLHKRGFLLWGPPGSGKTSTLQLLIKRLVEHQNGFVMLLDAPHPAALCLQMARGIEPKRPMVAVMEDMDALVRKYGENEYLSLLDGEAQVDNIVFLGTTNYPEYLDRRFVDRPSRFDTIRHIGMPSSAARKAYLQAKEPTLAGDELDEWVSRSRGFSVAHLKEMIIAVRCFEQSLDDVVTRLEEMQARKPTSEDSPDRRGAGFLNGNGLHA